MLVGFNLQKTTEERARIEISRRLITLKIQAEVLLMTNLIRVECLKSIRDRKVVEAVLELKNQRSFNNNRL
jgi:hypothetical protein